MNGKHEAAAKGIVARAVVALAQQAARIEFDGRERFLRETPEEGLAGGFGESEAEGFDELGADAAFGEIGAGFGALRSAKARLKQIRGDGVDVVERAAKFGLFVAEAGAPGHGDAVTLGEEFQSLEKREAVDLHDELQDVAADAASEAVIHLPGLIHRERRRLFLMEGAEADVAAGGAEALEAHVFADRLDDVDLGFELLDEFHAEGARSQESEVRRRCSRTHLLRARVTPSPNGSMLRVTRESA